MTATTAYRVVYTAKTLEYTCGWNSAINACVLNPYGYDGNERAVRWEQGRSDALRAFGSI